MELLCGFWVLVVGGWAVWKGAVFLFNTAVTLFRECRRRSRMPSQRQLAEWERQRQMNEAFRRAEQKARDDARAACEFLYALHGPEIRDRFTRAMLDEFIQKYMGNERAPEQVEERAEQLRDVILKQVERVDPLAKQMSLADLALWHREQKSQIDAIALDDEDKQLLLSQLEERYMRLQEKYLRNLKP